LTNDSSKEREREREKRIPLLSSSLWADAPANVLVDLFPFLSTVNAKERGEHPRRQMLVEQ
jgi:hypothetical protein